MNISIIVFLGDDTTKENYFKFFYKSHKFYANKFNYELLIIDFSYDSLSIHDRYFLKLNTKYLKKKFGHLTNILYLDYDIFINPSSPAVDQYFLNTNKVYICDENSNSKLKIKYNKFMGFESSPQQYYINNGFELSTNLYLNTGVMIYNFENFYDFFNNLYNDRMQYKKVQTNL